MEEFYQRYLKACKESHLTPLECVTSQLMLQPSGQSTASSERQTLDLSSNNFTPEDCNVLARVLSYDNYFTKISFSDCLLSEDASKILLYGLAHTRTLEIIDLKGNNLRCSGAEVIGLFLKKNTSVKCLRLDWNSLGHWSTGMSSLAEGLAVNRTLTILDLRNNQISHESASELATCLKRNGALKVLDLRWNNIGLIGGRAFLTCLQYNKTLTTLDLQGNNVPEDILKAIGVAVKVNNDRQMAMVEESARTEKMMKKIERMKLEKTMQVSMLQDKLDEQTVVNDELTKSSHTKIYQLKEALEHNKNSFNKISEELQSARNKLSSKEQENGSLNEAILNIKNELATLREANKAFESQLLISGQNKANLEQKIAEMSKQDAEREITIRSLEKDIAKGKDSHKEEIKILEGKHEVNLKKVEERYRSEREDMLENWRERECVAKKKLEAVEKEKQVLEETASELRSEVVAVKLKAKEEAVNMKSELKHENLLMSKQHEEKLGALQSSKDDVQSQLTKSLSQVSELQMQLTLKTKEYEQCRHEREDLTQQLIKRDNEHAAEFSRVRMELESERRTQEDLKNKIASLEQIIKDNARKQKDLTASKDQEIANLEEKLQFREDELRRQREEEVRRAELLESAVFTYVSSTKASRASSPCK